MRVNRWLDFLDRVGWTAVQASGGAIVAALTADVGWRAGLTMVGVAVLLAVAKVAAAQNVGSSNLGAAVPGHVVSGE